MSFIDSKAKPTGTRDRIIASLRRGPRTVEELAAELELTDNAVRPHLAALERDGVARQGGVRRGGGPGKPALVYEIDPGAEPLFSRAYAPLLAAIVEELGRKLPSRNGTAIMKAAGRRLAEEAGRSPSGDLRSRVAAGARLLNSLGGDTEVERQNDVLLIRACGACPLSAAVSRNAAVCQAVETLLSDYIGAPVRQRCDHGERPRCLFEIPTAA